MPTLLEQIKRLEKLDSEIRNIQVPEDYSYYAQLFSEAFALLKECIYSFTMMTPKETAELFRVSTNTVWNWRRKGLIRDSSVHTMGLTIRFNRLGILRTSLENTKQSSELQGEPS